MLHRASGFWFNEQQWFCSPRCLEESLEDHLLGAISLPDRRPAPVRTTMPMGLMMLSRGVISDPQLRDGHPAAAQLGRAHRRLPAAPRLHFL